MQVERLHVTAWVWDTSRYYKVGDVLFIERIRGRRPGDVYRELAPNESAPMVDVQVEQLTNVAPATDAKPIGRCARVPTRTDPTMLVELHLD